jgi:cytochrome c553
MSRTGLLSLFMVVGAVACAGSGTQPAPSGPDPSAPAADIGAAAPGSPLADVQPATTGALSVMRAPPVSGGTLAVLADGRTAVASDPDRNRVYVVDLVTQKLTASIALQAGDEPGRLVEDAAGRVHVALRRGGALLTVDPRQGIVLARRTLCAAPRGLAFDKAAGLLHLACAGGEVISIDPAPAVVTPARAVRLDRDLRDVMVKGSKLLVSTFRGAEVLVVDGTGVAQRLAPPTFPSGARGFGFSSIASPAVAWRMIAAPGGGALMLHQRGANDPVGTKPSSYGGNGACAGIVEDAVTTFDPDAAAGSQVHSSPALGGALVAADIAVSPDGRQLAIASIGGAAVGQQLQFFAVDSITNGGGINNPNPCLPPSSEPMPPAADGAGDHPTLGGGGDLLAAPAAYLPPNGEVIAVAFDPRGNVIVQSRQPATLQILTQRLDPVILSTESHADVGHQIFHTATSGMMACVSCHPEGGEDGRVWQFQGLGARRTQSLRGGIMDTAPFHWSGDLPGMNQLMTDVFQGRMSGPTLEQLRVDALGAWLDQIPTIPTSAGSDPAAAMRGRRLFETSAGCVACHLGNDHTNGATVDVGTGAAFQVPQLHGLAFRAPYMHDGCAKTLQDRFGGGCGGDSRHGVTDKLSPAQISDLIAYLETF